jgi:CubicO group peptidase (beta-lactamase class C family)
VQVQTIPWSTRCRHAAMAASLVALAVSCGGSAHDTSIGSRPKAPDAARVAIDPANLTAASRLDASLREVARRSKTPGFSVGLVVGDRVVYSGGFGVASLKTGAPVTSASIFNVASIAKTFTSSAMMQLVERGLVDLEAPVVKYLPDFSMKDPRYRDITINHLLSHRSGLPHGRFNPWTEPDYSDDALHQQVLQVRTMGLQSAPGEKFSYSNG